MLLHAAGGGPWDLDVGAVIPIAGLGIAYAAGLRRMTRRRHRDLRIAPVAAFTLGWLALVAALVSPLHDASDEIFSAHMVQHELLMAVAAPLLVVARPLGVLLFGVPAAARTFAASLIHRRGVRHAWRLSTRPFDAWLVHGAAIWLWHIPMLFQATLHSDAMHAAQHLSFFGSAVLFWWSILQTRRRATRGIAIVALFTTAVHTSVLGALLTFSRQPWYPEYAVGAARWHLTPIADQQLAGMIMWIPASAAYLIAALAIMRRWLRDSEWRVAQDERSVARAV